MSDPGDRATPRRLVATVTMVMMVMVVVMMVMVVTIVITAIAIAVSVGISISAGISEAEAEAIALRDLDAVGRRRLGWPRARRIIGAQQIDGVRNRLEKIGVRGCAQAF